RGYLRASQKAQCAAHPQRLLQSFPGAGCRAAAPGRPCAGDRRTSRFVGLAAAGLLSRPGPAMKPSFLRRLAMPASLSTVLDEPCRSVYEVARIESQSDLFRLAKPVR